MRRFNSLAPVTKELTEGVTPDGEKYGVTDVRATVKQYGNYVTISDVLDMAGLDKNITEVTEVLGEQAAETIDNIIKEEIFAGTTVQYAGGVASRDAVAGKLTGTEVMKAVRTLRANKAKPVADGYYVAFIDPHCAYDLMKDPLWQDVSKYSNKENIEKGEIGKLHGVRFIDNTNEFVAGNVHGTLIIGQDAYGIVDILMHTIERYFNPSSRYDFSDAFAEGLIRKVLEAGLVAYNNPNDIDSRSLLMLASSFSHNGITSIGKPYTMYVHQLEHVLSGVYKDLAHAAGLAILFPKWARFYLEYDLDKFDLFAKNVFHSFKDDKYQNGLYAIECLENYFKQLNMPSTLQDVGIENVDINYLADKFSNNGTRAVAHYKKPLDRDVAFQIYEACIKEVIE